jgi:hypothetical protein
MSRLIDRFIDHSAAKSYGFASDDDDHDHDHEGDVLEGDQEDGYGEMSGTFFLFCGKCPISAVSWPIWLIFFLF